MYYFEVWHIRYQIIIFVLLLPDYGKNYGPAHFTEACIQRDVFSRGPFLDVPYQDNTLFDGSIFLSYITSRFCTWSLVWNSRLSRWFLCHLFVAHLHLYYVSRSNNTETEQMRTHMSLLKHLSWCVTSDKRTMAVWSIWILSNELKTTLWQTFDYHLANT